MDFDKPKGYRPQIVSAGKDDLKSAGQQAAIDQMVEAATDTRDGQFKEEIYSAAKKFVDATETLGVKKRKSKQERDLDVERLAFGIAIGINTTDESQRAMAVESSLGLLSVRATNPTRRRVFEDVAKTLYEIHKLPYPPKSK